MNRIKASLLYYWRYLRGFVAAPEACIAWWQADVLAYKNGIVCEVEIKTTIRDLKNDIRKKGKHEGYAMGIVIPYTPKWAHKYSYIYTSQMPPRLPPNLFYFCVPKELADEALKYIDTLNKSYGLLVFDNDARIDYAVSVKKKARRLHKEKHPQEILIWIGFTLTARTAACYEKLYYTNEHTESS